MKKPKPSKAAKHDDGQHVQAIDDLAWWQQKLPPDWRVHGWTFRDYATVVSPSGAYIEVRGELLKAITNGAYERASTVTVVIPQEETAKSLEAVMAVRAAVRGLIEP